MNTQKYKMGICLFLITFFMEWLLCPAFNQKRPETTILTIPLRIVLNVKRPKTAYINDIIYLYSSYNLHNNKHIQLKITQLRRRYSKNLERNKQKRNNLKKDIKYHPTKIVVVEINSNNNNNTNKYYIANEKDIICFFYLPLWCFWAFSYVCFRF